MNLLAFRARWPASVVAAFASAIVVMLNEGPVNITRKLSEVFSESQGTLEEEDKDRSYR